MQCAYRGGAGPVGEGCSLYAPRLGALSLRRALCTFSGFQEQLPGKHREKGPGSIYYGRKGR